MNKYVGLDNFSGNIFLRDLRLPQDNPAGGIDFNAVTELYNPSSFSMDLGNIVLTMSYKNVVLGVGTGTNTKIVPGNNTVTLKGILQPHTTAGDLSYVSELFTNYMNGESSRVIAIGQSTQQADGTTLSWLSQGFRALTLSVPFKAIVPIDPIRSIEIGDMALQFDKSKPWTPAVESHTVNALLGELFPFVSFLALKAAALDSQSCLLGLKLALTKLRIRSSYPRMGSMLLVLQQ